MGKLKIKDHPIGHLVPMESRVISDREVEAPKGATVKEHRTPEQREANEKGHFVYLVGTDKGDERLGTRPPPLPCRGPCGAGTMWPTRSRRRCGAAAFGASAPSPSMASSASFSASKTATTCPSTTTRGAIVAGDNHDPCCWLKNFPGPVATILIPYTLVIWHRKPKKKGK